jgi:phenylalanyl-tRNA synthetase beta chain
LDFFDLKGALEMAASIPLSFRRTSHSDLALAAEIFREDQRAGLVGQLAAGRNPAVDTTKAIIVLEIDLEILVREQARPTTFHELEKFPSVRRDIAMIVPDTVTHAEILAVIEKNRESLLERVELFDLFSGKQAENFGPGRKSLAYTLTYRDKNRTLTSEEVAIVHARIRERLQKELAAELRE